MKKETMELILALEALIDDMAFRRNPSGTWGGFEDREAVQTALAKALEDWKES